VAVLHASLLDTIEKAGWSRLPVVSFFGHDACGVVLSESFLGNRVITQVLRDLEKPLVSFPCPVGAAVLEHELVDCKLSVLSTKEPDGFWSVLCGFPDSFPYIALVDVDLSALGKSAGLWTRRGRCGL